MKLHTRKRTKSKCINLVALMLEVACLVRWHLGSQISHLLSQSLADQSDSKTELETAGLTNRLLSLAPASPVRGQRENDT